MKFKAEMTYKNFRKEFNHIFKELDLQQWQDAWRQVKNYGDSFYKAFDKTFPGKVDEPHPGPHTALRLKAENIKGVIDATNFKDGTLFSDGDRRLFWPKKIIKINKGGEIIMTYTNYINSFPVIIYNKC
jgi:hypothetical protein